MKIVFSHPTGNANSRAAAMGLLEGDILSEFHTSIASFPGSLLDQLGRVGPLAEIRRRRFAPQLQPITRTWPWYEAGRQMASKAGLSKLVTHETGIFSMDSVYQHADKRVASRLKKAIRSGVNGVYAYEDGAAESFRVAKSLGLRCFYDLPIGHWRAYRRLLALEGERWPEWVPTLKGLQDSEAKLARKDEELRLADRIFVASKFTASTLQDFPGPLAPIEVIPYGFPDVSGNRTYSPVGQRPLKLLFVGILSQHKGIADLLAAVEQLGNSVELTLVGRRNTEQCPALDAALARYRWIPSLPNDQVLQLMRTQDVMVFPSLLEGFGMVITEAMSQGTPVITTDRTAGADLIEHGRNGWLVKASSTEAIRSQIDELLLRPNSVAETGREAMETARQRPWSVYGRELAEAIHNNQ